MASISSTGSFPIPAAQLANDKQSRRPSEQIKDTQTAVKKPSSSSVTQTDDKKSVEQQKEQRHAEQALANGEQQKIEAAQQEAQRAEFDQQTGNARKTEPNDVRPPSSPTTQFSQERKEEPNPALLTRDNSSSKNAAIDTFNKFQNIDAPPRQGQELNHLV